MPKKKPPERGNARRKGPPTIAVERNGQDLEISPPVPELEDVFYTAEIVGSAQPDGFSVHRQRASWVERSGKYDEPHQIFSNGVGLEPLVVEWLEANGYRVKLRPGPRPPLPALDSDAAQELGPRLDKKLLEFVRNNDRALIRYLPKHVQPARLIAQIALAWPENGS